MKILITGATGFIGKKLVERLISGDHEIVCLVRRNSDTGYLERAGVKLVLADIKDQEQVGDAFAISGPDLVVHSAARVKDRDKTDLWAVNVEGTGNICRECVEHGVDKLVYLSSVAVVSGNREVPLTEDMPYKASNVYGRSKIEAEKIVLGYRKKGLKAVILRPGMVFGIEDRHAVHKILGLIDKRLVPVPSMEVVHDRLQLVYIDNLIDVILVAMEKKEALEGTFFVADKEIISIREFVEIVSGELGRKPPLKIPGYIIKAATAIPLCRNFYNRVFRDRVYDIGRMLGILGYEPAVSTREGLRRTVKAWKAEK